eukprot:TRINITY_DN9_c0_g1_i2.p1 TRINITY_DN9_c0_g1~~TRINITY_DN9_c0_g1_i2.p1  ORF type:complete len:188 (-),score=37.85 TRINITY_DN9_c0_g1_i2:56-619(-)
MGVGDWMSTRAEVTFARAEREREVWECDNFLEGEKDEMVELYVQKGLPEETAQRIVDILSSDKRVFVDVMMIEELGIMPDDEYQVPWKHGTVNFTSFMIFGIVPIAAYLIYVLIVEVSDVKPSGDVTFYVSIGISVLTMFLMGVVKAGFTGTSKIKSALITVLLGGLAGAVGFLTGWILYTVFGVEE